LKNTLFKEKYGNIADYMHKVVKSKKKDRQFIDKCFFGIYKRNINFKVRFCE